MRKITIELSQASCEAAINALKGYKDDVIPKLEEVCRRLAEIGAEEARLWAQLAQGYGNDDVHISTERMDNGYKVVMSGADIYFVEFGTGDFAGEYAGDTSNVSVGTMPGDWSDTHARRYSQYGYWYYDNVRYHGTPAEMPMYHAGRRIREEMPKIAREVFGQK
jgi:hypothetical protein